MPVGRERSAVSARPWALGRGRVPPAVVLRWRI